MSHDQKPCRVVNRLLNPNSRFSRKTIRFCTKHQIEICSCFLEISDHRTIYPSTIEPKTQCTMRFCNNSIPGTYQYAIQFGNVCSSCNSKANHRAKERVREEKIKHDSWKIFFSQ